ncbi:MAG: hypothetical protein WDM87_16880 [Terracidiphilus sp.]
MSPSCAESSERAAASQAAGRIRTVAQVRTLLEAGANRIGSSASVAILRELGAE